jgi:enoyl-CoA hydratase/carnithine racemase
VSADAPARELAGGKLLIDEPRAGVVRMTISNPDRRNALDHRILAAITVTLRELAPGDAQPPQQAGARCVIVTGAHEMFSAGYDIGDLSDSAFKEQAERLIARPFTEAIDVLESFPYPTLAVLPGHAIGGGLELALACDLRVAREDVTLAMPPAKLGLVYSYTGLRRFLRAIGAPRTRELFLLARAIDAPTALAWGLVNRVVAPAELEPVALELAGELAANAPLSQQGNKRVIAALLAAGSAIDERAEQELNELRLSSFSSADIREGMRAFAEKRAPRWQGR